MTDYKIQVNSPEESERVQDAFFALGGRWCSGITQGYQHCDERYLYLTDYGDDVKISYGNTDDCFKAHESEEVTIQELERIVLAEGELPKTSIFQIL